MTIDTSMPQDGEQKQTLDSSLPFMPENETEVARQMLLHRRLGELMGDVLPPSLDLPWRSRVLDVGCGAGGWVYEMAWRHPDMQVIGIDKSAFFIERAQAYAGIGTNAHYMVQDMHHLDEKVFQPGMFDLVHLRFLAGEVTPEEFPLLIHALARLCRVGGYLVWTEAELPMANSLACQQLSAMVLSGLKAAGRAFIPGNALGVTALMGRRVRDARCQVKHDRAYAIEVSAGMPGHDAFARQLWVFGHQVRRFLLEMGVTTATAFDEVFAQAQREIEEEDFCGMLVLRTVVGVKV